MELRKILQYPLLSASLLVSGSVASAQSLGTVTECDYGNVVDTFEICASDSQGLIGCYRTSVVVDTYNFCQTVVVPNQPGYLGGPGGGGGGGPAPNIYDTNADGKVDCWKNISANSTAPRGDGFGVRLLGGQPDNHTGIDISIPTGTNVHAGADGIVLAANDSWAVNTNVAGGAPAYGNFITINFNDGTQGQYYHLESVNVTAGQLVAAGQVIATSNNTGRSTNAHLHYAVWRTHNHPGANSKDFANFHDPEQHHGNCPATP